MWLHQNNVHLHLELNSSMHIHAVKKQIPLLCVTGRNYGREDCDSEQVCGREKKVDAGVTFFKMITQLSLTSTVWVSVFVFSLISVIYPLKTVCVGLGASVCQVLLTALESVSCLLPLVCLIICPPFCLSVYSVSLRAHTTVCLAASPLTCLSPCWSVCLLTSAGRKKALKPLAHMYCYPEVAQTLLRGAVYEKENVSKSVALTLLSQLPFTKSV